jgi:hypothetical protein
MKLRPHVFLTEVLKGEWLSSHSDDFFLRYKVDRMDIGP